MSKILREYIRELLIEMPVKTDFVNTYKTAQQAHRDQKRRSGEDYFEHPKAVRNIVAKMYPADRVAQLAALLHDTLEDYEKGGVYQSEEEVIDAITAGIEDPSETDQVLATVQALTHGPGVSYNSYLVDLAQNEKIAALFIIREPNGQFSNKATDEFLKLSTSSAHMP